MIMLLDPNSGKVFLSSWLNSSWEPQFPEKMHERISSLDPKPRLSAITGFTPNKVTSKSFCYSS